MFLNADGRLTATGRYHVVRQAVPDGGFGDREGPAADGRQLHGRHQQTIVPSTKHVEKSVAMTTMGVHRRRLSIVCMVAEHSTLFAPFPLHVHFPFPHVPFRNTREWDIPMSLLCPKGSILSYPLSRPRKRCYLTQFCRAATLRSRHFVAHFQP